MIVFVVDDFDYFGCCVDVFDFVLYVYVELEVLV